MGNDHSITGVARTRLATTIILNLIITVAEFLGGILSGYLALLADAVHNLSDVAALILAWLGAKGAQIPATKRSTYGMKRLEVMTALISATALVVISVFIFQEAYHRLINPRPIEHPWLFLSIAGVGLVGNVLSVWLLSSEKGKSLNMKSAFLHMVFDALSSVGVIVGGIVIMMTGWTAIDAILSAVIGLMILWSSYAVIKEGVLILLEAVPADIDFDRVHRTIASVPQVRDVHDLHIWSLSSNEIALSCHVCLDDDQYDRGPEIITRINNLLCEQFGIGHGTIQLEKSDCTRADLLCKHHDHQ